MYKIILIMPILLSLFLSCSNNRTLIKENLPEKAVENTYETNTLTNTAGGNAPSSFRYDPSSLSYNYKLFRDYLNNLEFKPYTVSDEIFFSALSNELISKDEPAIWTAITNYSSLTNIYTNDAGFLYRRIGICYFKLQNYLLSDEYINLAIMNDDSNSECYYYKSMLLAYYGNNLPDSLYYLNKINAADVYNSKQDLDVFKASIYSGMTSNLQAFSVYQEAIRENPLRFYMNYNIVPFLLNTGRDKSVPDYLQDEWKLFKDLTNSDCIKKYYNQLVMYNKYLNKSTFVYDVPLTPVYNIYTNIMYSFPSLFPIQRKISAGMSIPVQEKRINIKDKIFYPVFEDHYDISSNNAVNGENSYVVLIESMLTPTMSENSYSKTSGSLLKYEGTNTTLFLLSPTNLSEPVPITNTNISGITLSSAASASQSNVIFIDKFNFTYFMSASYFYNDRNQIEYIILGFNNPDELVISIFNPQTFETVYFKFQLRTSSPRIVIQDIDNSGKERILLIDDTVKFAD